MRSLQGKKLLVLAGAAVHEKVVRAAKEMGVYTVVTDNLPLSPAKAIADEAWMLSITDVNGIVQKCREEGMDGVLNFCIDPGQIPYQRICEKLGMPCYGTAEQFFVLTNKPAFKKTCAACGLDTIPSYSERDIAAGNYQLPLYVKPADSRGSRGQCVCCHPEEIASAIENAKKESQSGEAVIERYMKGFPDFSMTYFVHRGIPYLIRTNDRYLGREEDHLEKQCIGAISPSKYSELYQKNAAEKAEAFIRALGIQFGPVFMQGFVDGEVFRFYDPGLRFPGGEYELFLREATGVDLMKAMIEFALTGDISDVSLSPTLYRLGGLHSIQFDFTCRPGVIGELIGTDLIKANPDVKSAFSRYSVGESVPASGDVRQRVYEIGMLVGKNKTVKESVKWVQERFDIKDTKGESMLISPLNCDLLDYE